MAAELAAGVIRQSATWKSATIAAISRIAIMHISSARRCARDKSSLPVSPDLIRYAAARLAEVVRWVAQNEQRIACELMRIRLLRARPEGGQAPPSAGHFL